MTWFLAIHQGIGLRGIWEGALIGYGMASGTADQASGMAGAASGRGLNAINDATIDASMMQLMMHGMHMCMHTDACMAG